jgi:Fur family transcriptional regulator, ferric uptake regulator
MSRNLRYICNMSSAIKIFTQLLKREGRSVTKARLIVFEQLLGPEPQSMHELVARCQGIDRASAYRAVELFEKLGIVQRLHTGWKYKLELSDKFAAHHHHLTCQNCGQSLAINGQELESFIDQLAAAHAFVPSAHQIEIQGLCSACQTAPKHL